MRVLKNLSKGISSEFQLRKFCFNYKNQDYFYRSQWTTTDRSIIYFIYRWISALFFIILFTVCLVYQFSDGKSFIFLTNWGIILCMLTQLVAALNVTCWHFDLCDVRSTVLKKYHNNDERSTFAIKLYWILHTITLPLALIITTIYWAFLSGKMDKPVLYPVISFCTHCLNSVFMLVDFLVVAFPMRLMHTVYSMLVPIIFCLFSVIYFFCGGTDEYGHDFIYPILDWNRPGRGIATFAGVFCLYIIFALILFIIYKLRRWLHSSTKLLCRSSCSEQV